MKTTDVCVYLDEKTRTFLDESWRLTPARMAEHLTNGKFQRYRHVKFLEKRLAQAIGLGGARLVITMPPRHGKSWLASLFTPAWFLSLWPEKNVVLATHDAPQAEAWARGVREFLKAHESELSVKLTDSGGKWATAQGGGMATTGVGSPIGVQGGDLLIIDDPIKSWKEASSESVRQQQIEWFNSTFYTKAEPGASIVLIMTRWHENDLAGYLEREHPGQWQVLNIPAIAEDGDALGRAPGAALCDERFGLPALDQIKSVVGSRVWQSLYQQRPCSESGRLVKRGWWKLYEQPPAKYDEVIQSWDLAFKDTAGSDYVVGQVWGRVGANKYLIDQVRAKLDFPATLAALCAMSTKYPQTGRKLIEDKANGSAVLAVLQDVVPGLIAVTPEGSKAVRVAQVAADIEAGNVYLPASAPWLEDFVGECSEFPNAKHDDQIDALAYALNHFNSYKEELYARTQCSGGQDLPDLEPARGNPARAVGE